MTVITEIQGDNETLIGFKLDGHANYSFPGRDIVCAAISAITFNTINSICELSNAEIETIECIDGSMQYTVIANMDLASYILLDSAKIGYKSIAEQYPENVQIRVKICE